MTKKVTHKALGQNEFMMLQHGKKVGLAGIIKAKCYECMGFYDGGTEDCKIDLCPLYLRMPYREKNDKSDQGFNG